jgi:hypothetical protein
MTTWQQIQEAMRKKQSAAQVEQVYATDFKKARFFAVIVR